MRSGLVAAVLIAALLTGCGAAAGEVETAKTPDMPITFGGPFSLIDHDGRPRTDGDFRGLFMLIFFGYTQCPNICPNSLRTLADALDILGPAAKRLQPLFITVDPARDTPPRLKAFVAQFHPRLIGLTGSERQIRAVARAYRVHRSKVVTSEEAAPGDYLALHSSLIYLMGPDGGFVTLFTRLTDAESMARALRGRLP